MFFCVLFVLLSQWLSALSLLRSGFSSLDHLVVGLLLMLGRDAWTSCLGWGHGTSLNCMLTSPSSFSALLVFCLFLFICPLCLCFVQVVILFLFCVVSYSIYSVLLVLPVFGTFLYSFWLFVFFLALQGSLFLLRCFSILICLSALCVSFLLGVLAACSRFLFQRLFCCCCHVAAGRRILAAIAFCDTVGVLEEVLRG